MVRLKLMPPLTRLVGEKEVAVDVGRASLKAVLTRAAARNAMLRTALLDAEGRLSAEYSCLVNGVCHNISDLDGIEVDEADEIVLLMPIAGGMGGAVGSEDGTMSIEVLVSTHVMGLDREREDAWPLMFPVPTIRLRDLIRAKVTREVSEYAAGRRRMVGKEYLMLDELAAFQAAFGRGQAMSLEAEAEVRKSFRAFEEGDYIVTVNSREVHDLDALVILKSGDRVQFLRLLPVAGGVSCGTAGDQGGGGAEAPRRGSL